MVVTTFIVLDGSIIEIEGKAQECPDSVFVIPLMTNFKKQNAVEFIGSQVHIVHKEQPELPFSLHTNWVMQPRINWTSFLRDETEPSKTPEPDYHTEVHTYTIAAVGVLFVIIIILFTILGFVIKKHGFATIPFFVKEELKPEDLQMTTATERENTDQ